MATAPQLTVSAAQARQIIREEQNQMRRQRTVPQLTQMEKDLARNAAVHIFNVGPWTHRQVMGSTGIFTIPACPPDKDYVEMNDVVPEHKGIPGIFTEPYVRDENSMELHRDTGLYIAEQVIGVGKHRDPKATLIPYGVFISEGQAPTAEEIATARQALRAKAGELYAEAISAFNAGPKEWEQTKTEWHLWAAKYLDHTDAPFMQQYAPTERKDCPMCGTKANKEVIVCASCTYIFDEAAWQKNQGRMASNRAKRQ